ncbi:Kidins220 [Symbiodinium pilosum]|uniref:Kidins220 protein n=1 Tax=Symbiodinium pilosum TaxID=2952 RepID=A0A812INS4_SYMPI|nr:Kidins220 [Symbiodinium pilosum]
MYVVTYSKALPYSIFFFFVWGAYDMLLRLAGLGAEIRAVRRGTWALKLMNLTHHVLITPLALLSMWQDPVIRQLYACFGCDEAAVLMNRAPSSPSAARALTPITIGYFTADLLLLSQWQLTKSSKTERYVMLLHHIASMVVWPAAVYFDWVARYVLIMLSYESTSLLLTLLWIISAAGYKQSLIYGVTGLLFTGLFFVLRMVGAVPQILAMARAPPWSERLMTEAQPNGIHPLAWLWCQSLILPHVMNLFWGASRHTKNISTIRSA